MDFAPKSFTFVLTRLASRYRTALAQSFANEGFSNITPDYWIVLEWLTEEDNMPIGTLAKRTSKDKAALSRIIDGMVRNGLVKRAASASDKRSFHVLLTKNGRNAIDKLRTIEQSTLEKATAGLNPIEVKELLRMMEHMYGRL